ncbi:MAG: thiamine phosphate synthase [Rhodospirillales bacterium]
MTTPSCRLYLITPQALDPAPFSGALAEALDAGDVASVQLRLKDTDDDAIRRTAEALLPVCRDRDVPLIMNDRPDLAAETGCDGVHIGQNDATYAEAREALGEDGLVGVTCHDSRHLALEAAEQGADYVAFGAFYPTRTKPTKSEPPIEILEWWSELMVVPVVAIGGITAGNCAPLVRAGADFLAVVSAVWDHPEGPAAAVRALNESIVKAR